MLQRTCTPCQRRQLRGLGYPGETDTSGVEPIQIDITGGTWPAGYSPDDPELNPGAGLPTDGYSEQPGTGSGEGYTLPRPAAAGAPGVLAWIQQHKTAVIVASAAIFTAAVLTKR